MSHPLRLSQLEILRVVQSLAQRPGERGRAVGDASLFLDVHTLNGFPANQVTNLASAVLGFFDLHSPSTSAESMIGHINLEALPTLNDWAEILNTAWNGDTLSFQTSGSTAIPARHRYALSLLDEELEVSAPFFASRSRIVSVMPVHHIFGMMYGLLLPKLLSIPVTYAAPLPLASFFSMLRPGDVVMGFPLFWQSLLEVLRRQASCGVCLPPDVMGVTAGSPCPPEVIRGLLDFVPQEKGFALMGMKEIYGSTETNGLGIRHDGALWYELFAHWKAVPLPDGTLGICRVRAQNRATQSRSLPDIVQWHGSRHFVPKRRKDNAVQVGGLNVYPEKVAEAIRSHPLVRDCVVRQMRPNEGSRLKVFIVPVLPVDEAKKAFGKPFRDWLAVNLDAACRPKSVRLGLELPVNAMGKTQDWD